MNILICNVGSTSLKYKLFRMPEELVLASGGAERVGAGEGRIYAKTHENGALTDESAVFPTHREAIARMLRQLTDTVLPDLSALDCVGFKVVLAKGISGVQVLTDDVLSSMEAFSSIAPAHNPPYLAAIRQFRALLPGTPLIGAFETAFHRTMPPEAYYYSIPIVISRNYDILRNGFHGASIEYMTEWTQERMEREDLKLVVCHLGGSGSICAVKNGKSLDTSLGLTLQCGTMHNNRCGDIDPSVVNYLKYTLNITGHQLDESLNKKSGLLGVSGVSSDMREIQAAVDAGNAKANLAQTMYYYRIKKYIGTYAAALGGVDVIVFTGGVGENKDDSRERACEGLEFMGVKLDKELNKTIHGEEAVISTTDSKVKVVVIPTDEELMIATDTMTLLQK